eukprot:SAG31_NODE_316_length_17841_cov_33.716154_12_plen_561_part_00
MGACNPKTLVGFMKALNAYFDQLAGSYPLMRIFLTYINSDFLANNMSVAFPMALNQYSPNLDTSFQQLFSKFIEIESRSMARVLLSISPDLVDDLCTMQAIKSATHQAEMFQADKLCGMSMIYSVFHRHSDNNHGFMRALKNALSSLSGLLANKNDTLNTLRTIMKTLILPAKKMVLKLEWEDAVKPIIRHLRDQSNTIYLEVIEEFSTPSKAQEYDCLSVLEEIFGRMIAIGQKNLLSSEVTINPLSVVTETTNFTSSIQIIANLTGEKVDPGLNLASGARVSVAAASSQPTINPAPSPAPVSVPGTNGGAPQPSNVIDSATLDAFRTAISSGNLWGPSTNGGGNGTRTGKAQYVPGSTTGTLPDVSASPAQKLQFALSPQCKHHQRHNAIERFQPTTSTEWTCQVLNCSMKVPPRDVKTMSEHRLSQAGMEQFWSPGLCKSCSVIRFFETVKEKADGFMVHKVNPNNAAKKFRFLDAEQKKQFDDLAKLKGVNPVPTAAANALPSVLVSSTNLTNRLRLLHGTTPATLVILLIPSPWVADSSACVGLLCHTTVASSFM